MDSTGSSSRQPVGFTSPEILQKPETPPSPDFSRPQDDILAKLSPDEVNAHLDDVFSPDSLPRNPMDSRPLPKAEAIRVLDSRRERLSGMGQDSRDVLFLSNYRHNADFRVRVNRSVASRNGPAGVPGSPSPAFSGASAPFSRLAQQLAEVFDPRDESAAPLFRWVGQLASSGLGGESAVHGASPVSHADMSASPAFRSAGKAVREAAHRNFVEPSSVNAHGSYPPSHEDESMASLLTKFFGKLRHHAVADTVERTGEKLGFGPDMGKTETDAFAAGVKMAPLEVGSGVLSLSAMVGRLVQDGFGGDDTALRQMEANARRIENELAALEPVAVEDIWVQGKPEETGRNMTRFLYQNLGNRMVQLPAAWLLSRIRSLSALTGISAVALASRINAGIIRGTGKGDPYTSVMVGVPLGLMVLMGAPFRIPDSVRTPGDFGAFLSSVLMDFGIGQVQEAGVRAAIDNYPNPEKTNKTKLPSNNHHYP